MDEAQREKPAVQVAVALTAVSMATASTPEAKGVGTAKAVAKEVVSSESSAPELE